jgi:hypothetical protein
MNTKPAPHSLIELISQISRMERGTISVLRQGPKGPYYNHQCYENGRNISRYVPPEQVPELKEALAGYAQYRQLTDQYAELIIAQTRAALAGSKKKPSRPPSSSPKTRKSSN